MAPIRVSVVMSGNVPAVATEIGVLRRLGLAVQAISAPDPRPQTVIGWVRVIRDIRKFNPDLVHGHFGALHGAASLIAAGKRPFVLSVRGSDLNPITSPPSLRQRIKIAITLRVARSAAAVITVSDGLKLALPPDVRGDAVTIPAGVDFERFCPMDRITTRRALGFGLEEPIVLFVSGRYPSIKRKSLAVAAFGMIRERVPDARFVDLDGRQPHTLIPAYLSTASVLLFTSRSEGSPNIVKEAMACNTPVVTVDVGDITSLTRGVSNAYVVPPDPRAIAAAAISMIQTPPDSNSRSICRQQIDVARTARAVLGVYQRTLGQSEQWAD